MRKKIFHNWGLKVGSIVIAFVLWLLVAQVGDPRENQYYNNISVVMTNTELLDEQNKFYAVLDNTDRVRVTIRAPRSILKELSASDIVAQADVSKLSEINTIAISFSVQNADMSAITINGSPDVLRLNVEDKGHKWVDVLYGTTGETAEGYMVTNTQLDQTRIEVTGPKSEVDQVRYARVEIDVTNAISSLSANVEVQLLDADKNLLELSNVTKNVNYVHMDVEVLATKEVPIELNVAGQPAEGFLATGVRFSEPATVLLAGTTYALSTVTRINIPAEQLDITGATENLVKTINIREYLPDSVRLADSSFNGRITATVYIEPVVERILEIAPSAISLRNIPEEVQIQRPEEEEYYELTISGLERAVSAVQTETLLGIVDVAAWMDEEGLRELDSGVYRIPVIFELPENVTEVEPVTLWLTVTRLEDLEDT